MNGEGLWDMLDEYGEVEVKLEDEWVLYFLRSDDFKKAKTGGEQGEELIEYGVGWELVVGIELTFDRLWRGVSTQPADDVDLFLTFRGFCHESTKDEFSIEETRQVLDHLRDRGTIPLFAFREYGSL